MGNATTLCDGQPPDPDTVPVEEGSRGAIRTEAEEILLIVEETVTVHKREVVTGKVRVRTVTDTTEELAKAALQSAAV
jgi:stress response protein YsnF